MGAGGGEVTPLQTVYALADAARQRGTTARTGVAATDVRVDNETVRGVRTAAGETVASDVVVNAGGP
jgi:glycine/D-amino acid oxidase-like deaminating enzyme